MLLWLTLTILWSTICWADTMYGNGKGRYFSSPPEDEKGITGIRVSVSPTGIIRSIQVRSAGNWSEKYGISVGHSHEFNLFVGEYITEVYGSYRIYIRYLVLYTNFGRVATYGKKGGQSFDEYSDQFGKVLTGVFGQYQALGITGIGFKWDYPSESVPLPDLT
ncbi:pancreatic adenocarcinoma up-regulated factor-like [Saccopteryx leptura]|uniref:pancreatic adenocarcinoma up-regulated factor-like n=1 Tax=Saccopteryx leptura TaxID=249018 RepID=UPI00339C6AEA